MAFYYLQIEHYALKIAFCVQCYSVLYFSTAYFLLWSQFVYFPEMKNLFVTKSSRISHLFGITVTKCTDYAIKIYVREVTCFHS